jgi:HlyD family secretion protein
MTTPPLPAELDPPKRALLPLRHARSGEVALDDGYWEKRIGWTAAILFFAALFLWGSLVRLDAAANASGVIAVSGSRQAVQHKDGGNVAAIFVKEGQSVKRGDLLIQLAGDDTQAVADSLQAQVIDLQAQRARLIAERDGGDMVMPAAFTQLKGDDAVQADHAFALQKNELATRRHQLVDQQLILHQQVGQLGARITGLRNQIKSNGVQSQLLGDQLKGMQELQRKGFASMNTVRDLQRSSAAIDGDTSRLAATVAETQEQVAENERQAHSLTSQRQQDVSEEMRTTEFSLSDLLPKLVAAKEAMQKTQIRAPVSGQVVGLQILSIGSVVTPGQKLLEIVPDKMGLVIEARVSPNDADDLHVGQKAEVRVTAFHDRGLPVINGTISRVSADSFEDQRTGAPYFTMQAVVGPDELAKLANASGNADRLKPGLPVEVLVPLRKRTLLQYIVEPLDQALWRSMREH